LQLLHVYAPNHFGFGRCSTGPTAATTPPQCTSVVFSKTLNNSVELECELLALSVQGAESNKAETYTLPMAVESSHC
jgi:hypothetical protein